MLISVVSLCRQLRQTKLHTMTNSIILSKEHYTYANGNLGSIHTQDGFFLDVEKETEKALLIQMYGKLHWLPKSAFVGKDLGHNCIVFSIKSFFANQIKNKL
jgi:hypothetical protein